MVIINGLKLSSNCFSNQGNESLHAQHMYGNTSISMELVLIWGLMSVSDNVHTIYIQMTVYKIENTIVSKHKV